MNEVKVHIQTAHTYIYIFTIESRQQWSLGPGRHKLSCRFHLVHTVVKVYTWCYSYHYLQKHVHHDRSQC